MQDKGLLGQLFGAPAIAAVAPGHIDERPLPAADDALEGLRVAGQDAGDIGLVAAGPVFGSGAGTSSQIGNSP